MTAWVRSLACILASRFPTWVLTVCGLTNSSSPISALDRPLAISLSTPPSRSVSCGQGTERGGEQQRVAVRHHLDRLHDLFGACPLEQETTGPGAQGVIDVV